MRQLVLVCLILLACPKVSAQQQEFSLQEAFHVTVPLRQGSNEYLEVRVLEGPNGASARLTVAVGRSQRSFELPTWSTESLARGSVLVADFNFDGWTDFALPENSGYGGVNFFHAVYVYSARRRGFERLEPPVNDYGPTWCNPKRNAKTRILETECKSGPFWYGLDFRFERGRPKLAVRARLAFLSGFGSEGDGDGGLVYLLERPGWSKVLSTDMHEVRPVMRRLTVDKVFLSDTPGTVGLSKRYLVRGDWLQVLEVRGGWCRVAYQSQKSGRLVGWINLEAQGLQLLLP
jgi:hypothetical protein